MSATYTAWLSGPAAFVLGLGLMEHADRYTLTARLAHGQVSRTGQGEGFTNAHGEPLEFEDLGTYATHLVRQAAGPFQSLASQWIREALASAPSAAALDFTATFTRDDTAPGGLVCTFAAHGTGVPGGAIAEPTIEAFTRTLGCADALSPAMA